MIISKKRNVGAENYLVEEYKKVYSEYSPQNTFRAREILEILQSDLLP